MKHYIQEWLCTKVEVSDTSKADSSTVASTIKIQFAISIVFILGGFFASLRMPLIV